MNSSRQSTHKQNSTPKPFYRLKTAPFMACPLLSILSIFFYGIISFFALFKPAFSLEASQDERVPNQIIVKYKDPSFSPLASESASPSTPSTTTTPSTPTQATESDQPPAYSYRPLYPGRIDVVIIEGENIQQLLEELKNDPNVEYVEPNYIKRIYAISFEQSDLPNDIEFHNQWALRNSSSSTGAKIDFIQAHALSRQSTPDNPVIIGIIDSSFATEHPDLKNQLWVNKDEIPGNGIDDDNNGYIDDIHGYNFAINSSNLLGEDNHGSHVAGICAAEKNNAIGVSGVFPNVKFIALACSAGDGRLSSSAILQAKEYLNQLKNKGHNIVAVNASYGSDVYSRLAYDAIKDLSDNGILFCAASGNLSTNLDLEKDLNLNGELDEGEDLNGNGLLDVSFPNSYDLPNIISVASVMTSGNLVMNSNYGKKEVDIAAPGFYIYSTLSLDFKRETQDIVLSDGTTLSNQWIKNSSNITGEFMESAIVDCKNGDIWDFPSFMWGYIALIERHNFVPFFQQVLNAMNSNAGAVIIYNNVEDNGIRDWTIDGAATKPWIPSFSISKADGQSLKEKIPVNAKIKPYTQTILQGGKIYGYQTGTSMAAPHVTAAVAFAAHNFPDETMIQRRERILNNVVPLSALSEKVATGGVLNLRKIVDTDEDKLPDWWEMEHFNTLTNSASPDSDNDGYTNREEFLSQTNPALASDSPNFKNQIPLSDLQITDNTLQFNFMAYPGHQYTFQSSDSLDKPWQTETTYSGGDGIPIKATIYNYRPSGKSQTFYRLESSR